MVIFHSPQRRRLLESSILLKEEGYSQKKIYISIANRKKCFQLNSCSKLAESKEIKVYYCACSNDLLPL